jgi:hypothetical protein
VVELSPCVRKIISHPLAHLPGADDPGHGRRGEKLRSQTKRVLLSMLTAATASLAGIALSLATTSASAEAHSPSTPTIKTVETGQSEHPAKKGYKHPEGCEV